MSATTLDRLLDGQVQLRQSAEGYRAGMDAVLLAAALSAKPGQRLVEFGCGPGAALLCAASRMEEGRFVGVEVDPAAADLARENVALNGLEGRAEIIAADMADAEPDTADQVFFNPPYFDDPESLRAPKTGKQRAWLAGETPLADWVKAAARALNAKGRLTLIHRADKLADENDNFEEWAVAINLENTAHYTDIDIVNSTSAMASFTQPRSCDPNRHKRRTT